MMNDLVRTDRQSLPVGQDARALTIGDRDRIRISAAWEALSLNSRRCYQGAWDRCGQWLSENGLSLEDLSDEVMAVYVTTLDAEGKSPSTISIAVAAVKCFSEMLNFRLHLVNLCGRDG